MSWLITRPTPALFTVHSAFFTGPKRPPAARIAAYLAVAATYLLIVFGAVVRATGSGLGCPDWPLCQGGALPPPHLPAAIEYSHRVLAAVTGGFVLVASVLVLRTQPGAGVRTAALAAPLVLVAQIALGALAVALELPPTISTLHLALALALLGLVVFQAVLISAGQNPSGARRLVPRPDHSGPQGAALPAMNSIPSRTQRERPVLAAAGVAVAVYLLALSGALVRGGGASLACVGFPLCNGQLWPAEPSPPVLIQLAHRLLALTVAAYLGFTLFRTWRAQGRGAASFKWITATAALILLQGVVGAIGVSTALPIVLRVVHVAGAAAVWGAAVGLLATTLSATAGAGQGEAA